MWICKHISDTCAFWMFMRIIYMETVPLLAQLQHATTPNLPWNWLSAMDGGHSCSMEVDHSIWNLFKSRSSAHEWAGDKFIMSARWYDCRTKVNGTEQSNEMDHFVCVCVRSRSVTYACIVSHWWRAWSSKLNKLFLHTNFSIDGWIWFIFTPNISKWSWMMDISIQILST